MHFQRCYDVLCNSSVTVFQLMQRAIHRRIGPTEYGGCYWTIPVVTKRMTDTTFQVQVHGQTCLERPRSMLTPPCPLPFIQETTTPAPACTAATAGPLVNLYFSYFLESLPVTCNMF